MYARLALAGLVSLLAGCASVPSRILDEPLPGAVSKYERVAMATDGLQIRLDQLIVRNAPGSWVRDASWDEYILAISNHSPLTVRIERFQLHSAALPTPQSSATSPRQLNDQSVEALRAAQGAGIIISSALAGFGGVYAAAGSSYVPVSTGVGVAAAPVTIVAAPVALMTAGVGALHVKNRHYRDKQDDALIELRMLEQSFRLPVEMPPGARMTQSIFFPITPAPSRLVVDYVIASGRGELSLELSELAQLHLMSAKSE
jgi:hypothetical protein